MTAYVATFYSFKGGVGRTTLLANVAHVLADRGEQVLVWDLDLEAPGIHQFPGLEPPEELWQSGFLEWLGGTPPCPSPEPGSAWPSQEWLNTLGHRVYATHSEHHGSIHVLPALGTLANLGRAYGAVDWHRLFVEHPEHGLHLLCRVRDALIAQFEPSFVLIDSRTGVSDLGGFVTGFVPDCTVLVGNYSAQSTQGLRSVYLALDRFATERVQSEPHRRRKLDRLLVASPVPASPDEQASARMRWSKGFPGVAPRAMVEVPLVENLLYAENLLVHSAPSSDAARAYAAVVERLLELRASYVRALAPDKDRAHQAAQLGNVAQLLQLLGLEIVTFDGTELIVRERTPLRDRLHHVGYLEGTATRTPELLDVLDHLRARSGAANDQPLLIVDAAVEDTRRAAEAAGVLLRTTGELMEQIVDLRPYATTLRRMFEDSTLARSYVAPQVVVNARTEDALAHAMSWAEGRGPQLYLLGGGPGSGKTSFVQRLVFELVLQFEADPTAPVPVLIDFREIRPASTIASLLHQHLNTVLGWDGNPDAILHLWNVGRIILLCDGFDELALAAHRTRYLWLQRLAQSTMEHGRTARGQRMLLTASVDLLPDTALRTGYLLDSQIATMAPFDIPRISTFLGYRLGNAAAKTVLDCIVATPTLARLASRPMLLHLLADGAFDCDDAHQDTVTAASLYDRYVACWICRRASDSLLEPPQRAHLLELLSAELWRRCSVRLRLSLLIEPLRAIARLDVTIDQLDLELRSASFVSRSAGPTYGFAHEGFVEYFLALHLARCFRSSVGAFREALTTEPIASPCAARFADLVADRPDAHDSIHAIALDRYTTEASENARRLIAALRPAQETSQPQPHT